MDPKFIDIHTHTREAGVVSLLNYSIGIDSVPLSGGFYSAGVHPWSAAMPEKELDDALGYLRQAPLAAIGEIGLDYGKNIDRELQKAVFVAQLTIASARRLPVVVHCVRAYADVLDILKRFSLPAVIFHGYTGNPEQTKRVVRAGCYISFGPRSMASPKTLESLEITPPERMFAETDDSGTSVTSIKEVYRAMAEGLGMEVECLAAQLNNNFNSVFVNIYK